MDISFILAMFGQDKKSLERKIILNVYRGAFQVSRRLSVPMLCLIYSKAKGRRKFIIGNLEKGCGVVPSLVLV